MRCAPAFGAGARGSAWRLEEKEAMRMLLMGTVQQGPVGGAEVNQENGDRTTHPDVRYGSVPDVNGYETMSRLVPKPDMSECRHWFLLPKQQNGVAKK